MFYPTINCFGLHSLEEAGGLSAQIDGLGPFLDPGCVMDGFRAESFFQQKTIRNCTLENAIIQITTTIEKLNTIANKSFDYYSKRWMKRQLTLLVKIFDKESKNVSTEKAQILQQDIIAIYRLGMLLLIGHNNRDFSVLSDLVENINSIDLKRAQQLANSMTKIAKDIIFEQRTQKMQSNGWTHDTNISTQEVVEAALLDSPKITNFSNYGKNPLLSNSLWKIIFHDSRTFQVFMRLTNSLREFKEKISSFLDAMGQMRGDNEAFDDLVRYHYDFMKSDVIPNLNELGLDLKTKHRMQTAWDILHSALQKTKPIPSWVTRDAPTKVLLGNLYDPVNRRLYPDSDPEKLANISDVKSDWAAEVLNELNEGAEESIIKYKILLRDPECTRYGLNAYLAKKITYNQFVSLCLAMSVINAYDPEVKMVKIVRCNDPSIRPYYHSHIELTNSKAELPEQIALNKIVEDAIKLTEQVQERSEHFVLFLEFVPNNSVYIPIENRVHSPLMKIINSFSYFLFPNKNHWIIPSFTLLDSILQTVYGPDYVKPMAGLGDFSVEAFEKALATEGRPFQINMLGVGNTILADKFITASYQLLSDPNRPLNDPTLWLHDLFHLNVVGAIPLDHRQQFKKLVLFLQQKEKESRSSCDAEIYRQACENIYDMQFLKYKRTFNGKKCDYSKAYHQSLEEFTQQIPLLIKAVNEFEDLTTHSLSVRVNKLALGILPKL